MAYGRVAGDQLRPMKINDARTKLKSVYPTIKL
jgi:hypothetical protein